MSNCFRAWVREFGKKMVVMHSASLPSTHQLLLFLTTSPGLVGTRERTVKEWIILHDWNCSQAGCFLGSMSVHVDILSLMLMLQFLFFPQELCSQR